MKRLDQQLVAQGLVTGRDRSKILISGGQVEVNGRVVTKASTLVKETDTLWVNEDLLRYVSRGGLKLKKGLDTFNIDPSRRICMDIGSSTGGFTHCLLQHGAKKVYAIDVGTGQMVSSIAQDSRVVLMEQTNIRHLTLKDIPDPINLVVTDVSFLSLTHVLPKGALFLQPEGEMVALVKPQFEAGPNRVGKGGIVRDKKVHVQVLDAIFSAANQEGLSVIDLTFSPITGGEGNIEYLLYLKKNDAENKFNKSGLTPLVQQAHDQLLK